MLVVTGAAQRAVDLIHGLRTISGDSVVAKLFAKHIKIPEQTGVGCCLV